MDAWVDGDTIYFFGDLEHESIPSNAAGSGASGTDGGVASVTVYQGGWTYSDAAGPQEAAGSEPGFHDQAANMFNLAAASNAATAQAFSIATTLQIIANCASMKINYLRDLFLAWSAPATCSGPKIKSSCGSGTVPCRGDLTDLCELIGSLPDVSTAFKKCMKGRCGCGGSYHPKAFVTCDSSTSCGPCGPYPGCNMYGSQVWYCSGTTSVCACANIIFHEMAHACGIPHSLQYYLNPSCNIPNEKACIIGDWFEDVCQN